MKDLRHTTGLFVAETAIWFFRHAIGEIVHKLLLLLIAFAGGSAALAENGIAQIDAAQVTTSSGTTRIIAKPKSALVDSTSEQRLKLEKIVERAGTALAENMSIEVNSQLARIAAEKDAFSMQSLTESRAE